MTRTIALSVVLIMTFGCGDESEETTLEETGISTSATGTTQTTSVTTDGVSPYIVTGTIYCFNTGHSSKVDTWLAEIVADDPQGAEDVASFGSMLYALTKQGDTEVFADMAVVCSQGDCTGSISETSSGISCDSADNYYFAVELVDNSGNVSPMTTLEKI
jgi:hypothetical protein